MNHADEVAITDIVDLRQAAHLVDFPDDPPFSREWETGSIRFPDSSGRHQWWLARESGQTLGVVHFNLRETDNARTALADLTVHPSARRRGIGTALANTAREMVTGSGRDLIVAESPVGGAAEAFARGLGAEPGLQDHRQRLLVTEDAIAHWRGLLADALSHARGYRVVRWTDSVPEPHVDDLAYLTARMSTDVPLDDLRWQPEAWDAERIRTQERLMAARGRRGYTTAAQHEASGRLVAFTTLSYSTELPTTAWQWDTIVDPPHRGHRLGMVIKVSNLLHALEHQPATENVLTWNALSNTNMNAINSALGFVPLDHWWEWQLRLRANVPAGDRQ